MSGDEFSVPRVQDELVGEMAELFGVSYDMMMFELTEPDVRQHALRTALAVPLTPPTLPLPETPPSFQAPAPKTGLSRPMPANSTAADRTPQPDAATQLQALPEKTPAADLLQHHIVSPAQTTERLQFIQKLVADQLGEDAPPDFETNVLQSIPVQAGGLYPISDVWYIDPGLDDPQRLRIHIAQFAEEIATEANIAQAIVPCDSGIGFRCQTPENTAPHARAIATLLQGLDTTSRTNGTSIGTLLCGAKNHPIPRLSDEALVKLFRLIRLARRLVDLEAAINSD